MTTEIFELAKKEYINNIKNQVNHQGGVSPNITIFGMLKETNQPSVIDVVIPSELINSEFGKDLIVDSMIPSIKNKVNKNFDVFAVCWVSEAWLRETKVTDVIPDNYKDLPIKKEVIIITIDGALGTDVIIFEMMRKGMQINENGEITNDVDLLEMNQYNEISPVVEGRFSGLYKKFKA